MRAMLSEINGGPAFLRAPLCADVAGRVHTHPEMARDDAYAAEWAANEARAILAVTEPAQRNHTYGPGYWPLALLSERYPNTSPMAEEGAALAEALIKWIEEV